MKSVFLIIALASLALSGCQVSFEETQYEPLIQDTDGLAVDSELTSRTLQGELQQSWIADAEPQIQSLCIQCHQGSETSPSFSTDPQANLFEMLLIMKDKDTLELSVDAHGLLTTDDQQTWHTFESLAKDYWPWVEEVLQASNQAKQYYETYIDSEIVQPVCSLCHRVQEDREPNLFLGLSFYPQSRLNHSQLNSAYIVDYLLARNDAWLIYKKASNLVQHGGGITIPVDSTFSQHLQHHAQLMDTVQQKLDQSPFIEP